MSFAAWIVAGLILWCTFGIVLADNPVFKDRFHHMNDTVLINWIMSPQRSDLILKIWFIGLCFIMVILGINLFFCSWTRFFRLISAKKANFRKYIMLFVHILFALAALSHFAGFIFGYKYDNIHLHCGNSFEFADGLSAKLANVHYIDPPSSLKLHHREQTPENFHSCSDYAEIVITEKGKELFRGRIFVLQPLRFNSIQITLKRFTPPPAPSSLRIKEKDNKNISEGSKGTHKIHKIGKNHGNPGVIIIISKSPALYAFFIIYPLMMFGIGLYLLITWRIYGKS